MATWLRDDSDLTTAPGINSTTIGTNLTVSGNEIDVSSGDLLLDVAGDINLDSAEGKVKLKKSGTTAVYASLESNLGHLRIKSGNAYHSCLELTESDLKVVGNLTVGSIAAGDGSSENFVVEQSGLLLKRTAAEVRSDLGIADAEIIDWTVDQGSTNIHNSNLPDSPDVPVLTVNGNANFTSTNGGSGTTTLFLNYTDGSEDAMTLGLRGFANQDSKLIFLEGATNKFVIGNDSSEDLFVIGSGSTLGADSPLTLNASGDCVLKGDLTVTGNDIKSSSDTAMTLSGANVEIAGNLTVTGNIIKSSTISSLIRFDGRHLILDTNGADTLPNHFMLKQDLAEVHFGLNQEVKFQHLHNEGIKLQAESALTNSVNDLNFLLTHATSGTPAVGIGNGITFQQETLAGLHQGMIIQSVTTNVGDGTEAFDYVLKLMSGGSTAAEKMRLTSVGDLTISGDLTVSGGNITNAITFDAGITDAGTISAGTWSGTALVAAKVPNHDDLNGFVANEHIDWTGASAGTIHATNYTDTTYSVMASGNSYAAGLVAAGSGTHSNQFLRKDGTWVVPTDTNTNQLTTFTVSATTDSNATTISQGDDLMFAAGTGITCETTADGTVTITNTVTDTNTDVDVNVANLTARLPQITESVTIGDATDVDVTIAGDLTVSGNTITFGNGETISNIVDNVLYAGSTNEWRVVGADASDTFMSIYEGVTGKWAFGNDDSASDSFVINSGANLGTTGQDFVLNTSGDLTLGGSATFGGNAGFTMVTPTFGASGIVGGGGNDTDIDFRNGNKASLTLTGSINNVNCIFPAISGNFVLVLKQDGTGSHTVTDFKSFIDGNTLATTTDVSWPSLTAGSHPSITATANRTTIVSMFWDATTERAYGSLLLNFL